jgi:hypothetical protein
MALSESSAMNTVAWWPHTSNKRVASARLRCFQIVEELERWGMDAAIYAPGKPPPRTLVLSKRYDAASVRHAADLRREFGTRLVLDLCDNHFYASNAEAKWQARADALRHAVATVDQVIASTPTLRHYIEAACPQHPPIEVVGDAVEFPGGPSGLRRARHLKAEFRLARLRAAVSRAGVAEGRRLLWFGHHGSGNAEGGMSDLLSISGRLESAHARQPLSLTIISNSKDKYRQITRDWRITTHYLDWHAATFSRAAALHDIAVIPIGQNPFTLCKTNNRVATAFVHGLAVAADSIPSYEDFAQSAVLEDWGPGLDRLMDDPAFRQARIASAMQLIERDWNLSRMAADWIRALDLQPPADKM